MYKLIFYVPQKSAEAVKTSIFSTGAGSLGNYSQCSFESFGVGQFMPNNKANPTIGEPKKLEKIEELRIEILCSESNVRNAINALKAAHPYEEPAYEVISICNHLFD